ncbi:mucin-5AC [Drosophila hydei]|uniref:Mucin-5AC n=1 Tax=Drosophila hydei TaxID=7224 RepID=A0A6J1LYY6_DROHY|nr:mucin-5AC [Drosophila hydei]
MPRMPMIALLLLVLLTMWSTQSHARAVNKAPVTESIETQDTESATEDTPAEDDDTTYAGNIELNTVTISVDSDVILTTEEGIQMFTTLADITTTEEPLPDSVVQQLEQERAERDSLRNNQSINTTEESDSMDNTTAATNQADEVTTTAPTTTTQPETETEQAVSQNETAQENLAYSSLNPNSEDSKIDEEWAQMNLEPMASHMANVASYATTEHTAMIAEEAESYGNEQTTNMPLMDVNTSGSITTMEARASATELTRMEQSTFIENIAEQMESTTEMDSMRFMTTPPAEPEHEPQAEMIPEAKNTTSTERSVMHLLSRLSLNTITQKPGIAPEAELITTEETIMQAEFTTAGDYVGSLTEPGTEPTVAAEATTVVAATPTESSMVSDSTVSAPISTTTEPIPIPTTELKAQATRAPRIERIFNSDGVEVLYGYSSVVRTNLT